MSEPMSQSDRGFREAVRARVQLFALPCQRMAEMAGAAAREAVRRRYLPERYVLNMESIRASWPAVNEFMQESSV